MRKIYGAMLPLLMTCACADPVERPVFAPPPPYPADINRPVGEPMLPDLKCLRETGQPCLGAGWSGELNSLMLTVVRFWHAGNSIDAPPKIA